MNIYEWTLFPTSTPVAGWGSLTQTFLRNATNHEISDWRIIYDTPEEEALPKKTEAWHPIRFSLQTGMCQARCTWGRQALQTPTPQKKSHKFCRIYCFSLNFYDYVQFKETYPHTSSFTLVFKSFLMSTKFYELSTNHVFGGLFFLTS